MSQQKQSKSKRKLSFYSLSSLQKASSKQQSVPSLYSKFLNISSTIEIEHNVSSLHMIQEDTGEIKAFNQKLQGVKLKQIENKNELLKANAQLFKQRRLSRLRQAQSRAAATPQLQTLVVQFLPNTPNQQIDDNPKNDSPNMFKTFEEKKSTHLQVPHEKKPRKYSHHSNSELADKKHHGILYFNQLKKHPKILSYTIQRCKTKMASKQQLANDLLLKSKTFAEQFRNYCHSAIETSSPAKTNSIQIDPSQIIEKSMRRIYSKQMPRKISQKQVGMGMNDFIQEQKRILDSKSKKRLPKQAYSKLKQRLDSIAYEINTCRRRNASSYEIRSKSMLSSRHVK